MLGVKVMWPRDGLCWGQGRRLSKGVVGHAEGVSLVGNLTRLPFGFAVCVRKFAFLTVFASTLSVEIHA